MSRFIDLILLLVVMFLVLVVQTMAGPLLDPIRNDMNAEDVAGDNIDATDINNDMFRAATVWVPFIGLFGSIIVVAFREYRRQRFTARRGGPPL